MFDLELPKTPERDNEKLLYLQQKPDSGLLADNPFLLGQQHSKTSAKKTRASKYSAPVEEQDEDSERIVEEEDI